jgi:cytochrome c biogenesis protein CcmG, thiol:disulfide interchange protein DsbE
MKKSVIFLTFLACCWLAQSKAQIHYYQKENGKIIDATTYNALKQNLLAALNAKGEATMELKEFFTLAYRNKDSTVYTYKWEVRQIGGYMQPPVEGIDQQNYLGNVFPLGSLKTIEGKKLHIDSLIGKPTLLTFWFINCPPCVEEIPVLNHIAQSFKDSVNFVSITFDPTDKVKRFLKKHPLQYTHIANARPFINELGINGFPLNIFLDKEGKVVQIFNTVPYMIDPTTRKLVLSDGQSFVSLLRRLMR